MRGRYIYNKLDKIDKRCKFVGVLYHQPFRFHLFT